MTEGESRNAIRDGCGNTIPVNDNNPGIVVESNDYKGEVVCTLTSAATPTRRAGVLSHESQKHAYHNYQHT